MLPIAVDAMGGDFAPAAIVEGAKRANAELGVPVVLVGILFLSAGEKEDDSKPGDIEVAKL